MRTLKIKILVSILLFIIFQACKEQQNTINKEESKFMLNKEIALIKTVPGGSRAHVIVLSKNGVLNYIVGAISDLNQYNSRNLSIDSMFKKIELNLDKVKITQIAELLSQNESIIYNDSLIVKDDMQFYLYFNGEKMAFGYEKNLCSYPDGLKKIIKFLLNETGKLYKISGTS